MEDDKKNQEQPSADSHLYYGGAPNASAEAHTDTRTNLSKPPKKSRKRLYVIVGASLALLLLAALGTYLVIRLVANRTTDDPSVLKDLTSLETSLLSAYSGETSGVSVLRSISNNPTSVLYKVADKSWVGHKDASPILSVSISRTDQKLNQADYDTAIRSITKAGLAESALTEATKADYTASQITAQFFASSYLVCNLNNGIDAGPSSGDGPSSTYFLSLNCSEKANFDATSNDAQPFIAAYASAGQVGDTVFRKPTIQPSAVKDYANAEVQLAKLSNSAIVSFGKFYQTTDKAWHYLASAEKADGVACSTFSTLEQQSAFIGTPCWDKDANKASLVTVPQIPGPDETSKPVE